MTPSDATPTPPAPSLNAAAEAKRRERERAERKREADRIRAAQKRSEAKSPAAAPVAAPSRDESLPPPQVRSDDQRATDGAVFLRALYRVASVVAGFFGYEVTPLSATEAAEDATYLIPLARRYAWLDATLTWVGAPAALAVRFASHLKKKPDATPEKKGGDVVSLHRSEEKAQ